MSSSIRLGVRYATINGNTHAQLYDVNSGNGIDLVKEIKVSTSHDASLAELHIVVFAELAHVFAAAAPTQQAANESQEHRMIDAG